MSSISDHFAVFDFSTKDTKDNPFDKGISKWILYIMFAGLVYGTGESWMLWGWIYPLTSLIGIILAICIAGILRVTIFTTKNTPD
jgi:polyferredoxin